MPFVIGTMWRKQGNEEETARTIHHGDGLCDDPRSAWPSKDPFAVDIYMAIKSKITASTTSSYQDNFLYAWCYCWYCMRLGLCSGNWWYNNRWNPCTARVVFPMFSGQSLLWFWFSFLKASWSIRRFYFRETESQIPWINQSIKVVSDAVYYVPYNYSSRTMNLECIQHQLLCAFSDKQSCPGKYMEVIGCSSTAGQDSTVNVCPGFFELARGQVARRF
jgi:hypothetical protein